MIFDIWSTVTSHDRSCHRIPNRKYVYPFTHIDQTSAKLKISINLRYSLLCLRQFFYVTLLYYL